MSERTETAKWFSIALALIVVAIGLIVGVCELIAIPVKWWFRSPDRGGWTIIALLAAGVIAFIVVVVLGLRDLWRDIRQTVREQHAMERAIQQQIEERTAQLKRDLDHAFLYGSPPPQSEEPR